MPTKLFPRCLRSLLFVLLCLGATPAHGQEKPTDTQVAEWRKAAEQGDAAAQYNLGWCYANGLGVTQNDAEAIKWCRKAAEHGDALAQNTLGICYANGIGVTNDAAEAAKWWHKAAEMGLAEAQNSFGDCCAKGHGLVKNEVEGYKWSLLAAAQGMEIAKKNVSNHELRLSPAQRSEGQRLAQEWKLAHANPGAVDLAKKNEIVRLLDLFGMNALMEQMLDQMIGNLKTEKGIGISDEFWAHFRKSMDTNELINLMVPIYEKYYSMEDLKAMNAFYSTDLGKRVIATMPQVMNEGMQVGQKWGESVAQKVVEELEKEKAGGVRKYNPATDTIE